MQVNWNPPHQLSLLSRPRLALARCGTRPIVLRSSLPRFPLTRTTPARLWLGLARPKKSHQTKLPRLSIPNSPPLKNSRPGLSKKYPSISSILKKNIPLISPPQNLPPTIQTLKKFSIIPYQNYSQIRRLNPIIPRLKDFQNLALNP